MSEEELYKLLNIPYKPWIELTDEEIQLFEKNNNYIKQLQQENAQLKQMVNSPSITFTTCPECGKNYSINYCREVYNLQQENENLRATIKNDDIALNTVCEELSTLKQQLKDKDEKISKVEKLTKQLKGSARYQRCMDELDYILGIIKED